MSRDPVVRLDAVSKIFPGGIVGLDHIDLDIYEGELLSLLGPSGCGKTTTLRLIAGFEEPSSGTISIAGQPATHARPYQRPVNTVFQDYALFPHMSVAENVGFGLSMQKLDGGDARKRISDALDLVGLADKITARVQALSGGQRQRVALARALVCKPRVLLLDEPLAALDAHLREQMQVELKGLQARLGTTFVMVTHDQTEALSISDRIAVMSNGRIEQIATPSQLYDQPATRFVAGFIGAMNLIDGTIGGVAAGRLAVSIGRLHLEAEPVGTWIASAGDAVTIAVRPEDVTLTPAVSGSADGHIRDIVFHGRSLRCHVALNSGGFLTADVPRGEAASALNPQMPVTAAIRAGSARIYPRA